MHAVPQPRTQWLSREWRKRVVRQTSRLFLSHCADLAHLVAMYTAAQQYLLVLTENTGWIYDCEANSWTALEIPGARKLQNVHVSGECVFGLHKQDLWSCTNTVDMWDLRTGIYHQAISRSATPLVWNGESFVPAPFVPSWMVTPQTTFLERGFFILTGKRLLSSDGRVDMLLPHPHIGRGAPTVQIGNVLLTCGSGGHAGIPRERHQSNRCVSLVVHDGDYLAATKSKWQRRQQMRFSRYMPIMVPVDEHAVYVIGGATPTRGFIERYNVDADTWRLLPVAPEAKVQNMIHEAQNACAL